MMSASLKSTIGARAAAIPALRAIARPVYGPGRWRTNGCSRAISARYSAVPSVEFESAIEHLELAAREVLRGQRRDDVAELVETVVRRNDDGDARLFGHSREATPATISAREARSASSVSAGRFAEDRVRHAVRRPFLRGEPEPLVLEQDDGRRLDRAGDVRCAGVDRQHAGGALEDRGPGVERQARSGRGPRPRPPRPRRRARARPRRTSRRAGGRARAARGRARGSSRSSSRARSSAARAGRRSGARGATRRRRGPPRSPAGRGRARASSRRPPRRRPAPDRPRAGSGARGGARRASDRPGSAARRSAASAARAARRFAWRRCSRRAAARASPRRCGGRRRAARARSPDRGRESARRTPTASRRRDTRPARRCRASGRRRARCTGCTRA